MGVITRVHPLEITHCSTSVEGNSIHRDSVLGRWKFGGRLKGINYKSDREEKVEMEKVNMLAVHCKATVTGGRLSLRQGDGWCAVTYEPIPGYVMERYLILDEEKKPLTEAERLEALENKTAEFEQRIAALEARVG